MDLSAIKAERSRLVKTWSLRSIVSPYLVSSIDWVHKDVGPIGDLFEDLPRFREREQGVCTRKPPIDQPNRHQRALWNLA